MVFFLMFTLIVYLCNYKYSYVSADRCRTSADRCRTSADKCRTSADKCRT